MTVLARSDGGIGQIQAMPLKKDKVNLTTGTIADVSLLMCVADGSVTVNWSAGGTSAIACVAGDTFAPVDATSITITSGTFHVA